MTIDTPLMDLPHIGHMTWSAWEVDGAEVEMPLWCVQANILAVSRFDDRPSSEIVIGDGVRPTAVARWDTDGVCSSSGVRSTFISSPSVVMGVTQVPFPFFIG